MARIIVGRLWRPVALGATALLLVACSALQLGYNQAPSLLYWWVDGYADLDDAQSTRLRQDIERFMTWHRHAELPLYAQRLQQWQTLAAGELRAEQVCAQVDALRAAAMRALAHGDEGFARLALTLTPAQLQRLERQQNRSNEEFARDFLRGSAEDRLERRLDRAVDRYESLYGSLTAAQVARVRQSLQNAPFDPARTLADRRSRQGELRTLLRQWQAAPPRPEAAARVLLDWAQRALPGASDADSETAGWVRHGCQAFADLHNSTSAPQRRHAQQVLQSYEDDLRALTAAH